MLLAEGVVMAAVVIGRVTQVAYLLLRDSETSFDGSRTILSCVAAGRLKGGESIIAGLSI